VWRALKAARVEVGLMSHEHLGTEHLLLGISVEGGSLAAQALNEVHVTPDRVREAIYQVLTTHAYGRRPEPGDSHAVTLPVEIRELDAMIAKLRLDKEQAIDSGDYQTAATIRNEEKQILARRATAVRTWAPQVDVARVVREVEHLRAEVRRLMRILRQQGIDADQEDHTSRPGTQAPE
jgi:ATP-dependent Clp protease ATP-binding subunit ClpA